jgi:DNA-directed RNA polymerase subunit alpha
MATRLGRFEMPKQVIRDDEVSTDTYGKFYAEPFEGGYGRTMGNSLRRVLLSSLEGAAVSSVKIKGAPHEYCSLDGVKEDVTEVVLNIKQLIFKSYSRDVQTVNIKVEGSGEVRAGDIVTPDSIEVLNPDFVICNLAEDGVFEAEMEVRIGRGYCPADLNKKENQEIGVIPVDCLFSPVRRVKYETDYDKLIIEIWTDGRVSPEDALTMSAAILRHHLDVFVSYDKDLIEFEASEKQIDQEKEELRKKLNISVNEIELSVRAANCLNNANITTVGELAQKTEAEMLKYRNFGKKSLNEIKAKIQEMGLSLGMTFESDLLKGSSFED